MGSAWVGIEVTFFESLEGLEARTEGQCPALLKDYRSIRQPSSWEWDKLPPVLYFEPLGKATCPRIAVGNRH